MSEIACPVCGGRRMADSKFCPSCGCQTQEHVNRSAPAASGPAAYCPACGHPAAAGAKFCMGCGAGLGAGVGRQPVRESVHTYTAARQPAPATPDRAHQAAGHRTATNSCKRRGRGPLIAVLSAVLAAAVLITGFWQPGFFLNAKTGGVLSAPYAGNSAAFSAMPLPGFTVSAEENALDRDRTFEVTEAPEDTFAEVSQAIGDGGLLLELYEVDAGLDEGKSFPGTFSMTYDLAELDIPEELYDYLNVYRIGDDGAVTELICTVEDGKLTCRSNKNCGIALVAGLSLLNFGVFFGGTLTIKEYNKKWQGLSGKSILHADICNDQYRVSWAAEDNSEWKAKKDVVEGLLAEIRQNVEYEIGSDPDNTGYNYKSAQARNQLLAQRISQDPLYMKHLKEFNVLTQNMADGTPQVKQIISALTQIHKYLAVEKGYTAPSSLTDVILIYDWPAGDGALGYAVNPNTGGPYIHINMSRFPADGAAASAPTMDELYLTVTHELFHVFQTCYTTIDWTGNVIFWEATACLLEQEAQSDYLGNKKDSSLPSMSAKQALTDTDWFETLSVPFGQMPDSGEESDCQRTGYTLSRLIAYIQTEYGCSFKLRALLETFKANGDFQAALQFVSGMSDSMLSNAYLNFCRSNVTLFYKRSQAARATTGNAVRSTLPPVVQLSASNDKVDVPVADAPLSAYFREFKVDTKSAGGEYALLLVSDPSLAAKQDYSLINVSPGVTKTTKGLFYPVKAGASSYLFEIHSYARPDGVNAFYTAYLLMPPEAPALSVSGNIMTVEMPPESRAARDGLIEGYLITLTASDGVVSVETEEHVPYGKWGEPLELKLSELSTLTGEVSYVVTAQEYIKDLSGKGYVYGPESPAPEAKQEKAQVAGIYMGESSGQYYASSETFELRYPAIRIEERGDGLLIGPCLENGDYESELQVLCTYNAETGYYEGSVLLESGDQWTQLEFKADVHLEGDVPSAEVGYIQTFSHHSTCVYYYEVAWQTDLAGQAIPSATGSSGSGGSDDTPAGVPVGGW